MLGESLVGKLPYLERDLRRLAPELVLREAQAISLAPDIQILEESDINLLDKFDEIVISNDDVGRMLEEKYLAGRKLQKDTTFLRWHNMNAITKVPASDDSTISTSDLDREFIDLAHKESEKSSDWWRHVGAVLVKQGKTLLAGYNKHFPTEHSHYIDGDARSGFNAGPEIAEIVTSQHGEAWIISEAARRGISTAGTDLYVTTFPCPTCAALVAQAGIKKVYYRDGYSLLDAEKLLKQSGIELIKVV